MGWLLSPVGVRGKLAAAAEMSDAGGVGPNACEQTVERMLDGLAVSPLWQGGLFFLADSRNAAAGLECVSANRATRSFCLEMPVSVCVFVRAVARQVIGRVFRSAFLGVGDCVRRVSYPLKEVVVNKYDQCMGRWTSHGERTLFRTRGDWGCLLQRIRREQHLCRGPWPSLFVCLSLAGTRTHRVSETVACFEAVEASEKSTVSSSDSSSEAS